MSSNAEAKRTTQTYTEAVSLTEVQTVRALAPTSTHVGTYLSEDLHDTYVTSRSVLGYEQGAKFLEVLANPGPALTDPPIAIEG